MFVKRSLGAKATFESFANIGNVNDLCESMREIFYDKTPQKDRKKMAEYEKFKDEAMSMLLKHSVREITNDKNIDIIPEKSGLNYSFPMEYGNKTAEEYYRELVGNSYLYGRGSQREKDAITCCSWCITLPKEISDYSTVSKDQIIKLNEEEEMRFFQGALDFINQRYPGCLLKADLHYDEGGQPHGHYYLCMRKELDHDLVHYKTTKPNKTSEKKRENWVKKEDCYLNKKNEKVAVKTESGRWEYVYDFVLDENGEKIPLKNYAKVSDFYDYKLAAAEIMNPIELANFHPDFAKFLKDNDLPGADSVYTKKTGGKNISVQSLKEITRSTGMTLDQIKSLQLEQISLQEQLSSKELELTSIRQKYVEVCEQLETVKLQLESTSIKVTEILEKDKKIKSLQEELTSAKQEIQRMKEAEYERQKYEQSIEQSQKVSSRWDSVKESEYSYTYESNNNTSGKGGRW